MADFAGGAEGNRSPALNKRPWSEQLDEGSFRQLFELIPVSDSDLAEKYLISFSNQQVYSVRLLLRKVIGLETQDAVRDVLQELALTPVDAMKLSTIVSGDYTEAEAALVEQGVLQRVDLSGDWTELLISLNIGPNPSLIAEELLAVIGEPLSSFLPFLRENPGFWEGVMREEVLQQVSIFQATPNLIDVLDAALAAHTTARFAPAVFTGRRVELPGHTVIVSALLLLPNGFLVSGSFDNTLRLWNLITNECVQIFHGHVLEVWSLALLPDGRVISTSADRTLRIWNLATGKTEKLLSGHKHTVTCVVVLSDKVVVSGSWDRFLVIWDVDTGKAQYSLQGRSAWYCSLLLPNGHVAAGDEDGRVAILDIQSSQVVRTLMGHTKTVRCLTRLSGDRLVSGSTDCTIRIWNYLSGACISVLCGHESLVRSLCVLADGRLVSGGGDHRVPNGGDKVIRVWNPDTGECTRTVDGNDNDPICALLALSDGRLVSGSKVLMIRAME